MNNDGDVSARTQLQKTNLDDVRRSFEDVWPHIVENMIEAVFASETVHAQGHVTDGSARDLTMDEVSFHEGVFEEREHGEYVILTDLADVFEQEG